MGENFTLEHVYLYHRLPCHLQSLLKLLTALPLDFKLTTQQFDSCWLQKSGRPGVFNHGCSGIWNKHVQTHYFSSTSHRVTFYRIPNHANSIGCTAFETPAICSPAFSSAILRCTSAEDNELVFMVSKILRRLDSCLILDGGRAIELASDSLSLLSIYAQLLPLKYTLYP